MRSAAKFRSAMVSLLIASSVLVAPAAWSQQSGDTPPPAGMTGRQLQSVVEHVRSQGREIQLFAEVTDALGLTTDGRTLILQQIATFDPDDSNIHHAFSLVPDRRGYVLAITDSRGTNMYWTDVNRALIAAIFISGNSGPPTKIANSDAQHGVDAEFSFWGSLADLLR